MITKAYLLLMYLNDIVRVHFNNVYLANEMTGYLTNECDKLDLSSIKQLLKKYKILEKKHIFVEKFSSQEVMYWYVAVIIQYLKVFLPTKNFYTLQKIEDLCYFDNLTDQEVFKVQVVLDIIIDKL